MSIAFAEILRIFVSMKRIRWIFVLFLLVNYAQGQTEKVHEFKLIEREPRPLNYDEIREKIGYPEEAEKAGIEGVVVARILVDKEGNYVKHFFLKAKDPVLKEAVEKELSGLKFSPAISEGKQVGAWVNIPFRFELKKE